MPTIITAVILLLITILLISGFVLLHKRKIAKRTKRRIDLLHTAAETYGLTFSAQEILENNLLGIDGIKQKLLIILFGTKETVHIIPMKDVATCILHKEYEKINVGTDKKEKIELRLRSIDLLFSYKASPGTFTVCFYDSYVNHEFEKNALETKARQWEMMLTKMIVSKKSTVTI